MNLPLMDAGAFSGLACGILFGYVLQRAGFSSPCRLTGQLRLTDWTVFRVMFVAIIVAATGLAILEAVGLVQAEAVYTPTTFYWAVLAGGALVGVGFAIGGYCPGTSVVGACSGKVDAVAFLLGLLAGTWGFAGVFERIEGFLEAAPGPEAQTLPDLLGLPAWMILALLMIAAAGGWMLGRRLERSSPGTPTASI